jgi:hypothetical protein
VLTVTFGQVVCVTASCQPGRVIELAVMPKVKLFMTIFHFLLVFAGISPQLQSIYGIKSNHTCLWGRSFCVVFFVPHLAIIIRGNIIHLSSHMSTSPV